MDLHAIAFIVLRVYFSCGGNTLYFFRFIINYPPKSAVSVHILKYITPDDSKFQIVICKFYVSEKDFGVKIM